MKNTREKKLRLLFPGIFVNISGNGGIQDVSGCFFQPGEELPRIEIPLHTAGVQDCAGKPGRFRQTDHALLILKVVFNDGFCDFFPGIPRSVRKALFHIFKAYGAKNKVGVKGNKAVLQLPVIRCKKAIFVFARVSISTVQVEAFEYKKEPPGTPGMISHGIGVSA